MVNTDEPVTQGQPLMKIDLEYLKEHAPSIITPVIITNQEDKTLTIEDVKQVDPGKAIMTLNKAYKNNLMAKTNKSGTRIYYVPDFLYVYTDSYEMSPTQRISEVIPWTKQVGVGAPTQNF